MEQTILAFRLIPVVVAWGVGDGRWSALLSSGPRRVLRDGQLLTEFTYDQTAKRIVVKGGDPRIHLFETVVRGQGIELGDKEEVKIAEITVTNTLQEAKAN